MKYRQLLLLLLLPCLLTVSFKDARQKSDWKALFNGKDFTGWDKYLAPDLDSTGKIITGKPIGLNNDPRNVFTVVKENGENIIRIS